MQTSPSVFRRPDNLQTSKTPRSLFTYQVGEPGEDYLIRSQTRKIAFIKVFDRIIPYAEVPDRRNSLYRGSAELKEISYKEVK